MPSRLKRKQQRAHRMKVYAFRIAGWKPWHPGNPNKWDVFMDSESILGPRMLELTRRQAVDLAHRNTISKRQVLTITTE